MLRNITINNTPTENIDTINIDATSRIRDYIEEIEFKEQAHGLAYSILKGKYKKLNMMCSVLLCILSTSLFLNYVDVFGKPGITNPFSITEMVISCVISVARIYIQSSEIINKYAGHDMNAKSYGELLSYTELRVLGDVLTHDEKMKLLTEMIQKMSIIEKYEIDIPNDVAEKIKKSREAKTYDALDEKTIQRMKNIADMRKKAKKKMMAPTSPGNNCKISITNEIKDGNDVYYIDSSESSRTSSDSEEKKIVSLHM